MVTGTQKGVLLSFCLFSLAVHQPCFPCSKGHIGRELGLQLNRDKSEVICDDSTTKSAMLRAVPGLSVTDRDHATLLGSPIGTANGIQDTKENKVASDPGEQATVFTCSRCLLSFK